MATTGKIGVTSENIFPVIKKFLYSEHDIFLRELVSNAVDATTKLNALIARGTSVGNTDDLKIEVVADATAGTLTIKDKGIGMTSEEVDRYINQIAFSGAEEFLEKYKDASANIIGHFGLGFYSAFMVANKVEINTLSYQSDATPVHWVCDGSPNYEMTTGTKEQRGTEIVLHLDEESKQFLEREKVATILDKYCKYLPIPIQFGKKQEWKEGKMQDTEEDNIINNTHPLWCEKPSELTEEQYKDFYKELYPMSDEPLFWIHLNVDYPFNLTGILYFPKVHNNIELQKNRIKLFCNQVYVTDEVEGIVPEYLTLLHGVLDSPDIPLNVSRSYLQGDPNVAKISSHITKKVADRLDDLFKNNRTAFEEKWEHLKVFIQYGILTDEKFYDRAQKFLLLTDVDGKNYTAEEYRTLVSSEQTDKNDQLVILYATDKAEQYSYIKAAQDKGYNVLLMNGMLDTPFMNHVEQKWEKTRFVRVDSDTIEHLVEKQDSAAQEAAQETIHLVREMFAHVLPTDKDKHFSIVARPMGADGKAAIVTQDEWMRRMKEMAHMQAGMGFYGAMPNSYNIVVNTEHPLVQKLLADEAELLEPSLKEERQKLESAKKRISELENATQGKKEEEINLADKNLLKEKREESSALQKSIDEKIHSYATGKPIIKQITDLALLSNGLLQGADLDLFITRSLSLLQE